MGGVGASRGDQAMEIMLPQCLMAGIPHRKDEFNLIVIFQFLMSQVPSAVF